MPRHLLEDGVAVQMSTPCSLRPARHGLYRAKPGRSPDFRIRCVASIALAVDLAIDPVPNILPFENRQGSLSPNGDGGNSVNRLMKEGNIKRDIFFLSRA